MSRCVRAYVSGLVQGVAFRASTRRQALHLGLQGYARNLADGRVEVVACGSTEAVDALKAWLWQGPPLAEVSSVKIHELPPQSLPSGFAIL